MPKTVITIGSFDGVHLGHQQLLGKLKQLSASHHCETLLITFHPHPRSIIFPDDDSLRLLNSLDEKIALLEAEGLDHLVVVPFTKAFSELSPQAYIEEFLVKFNPAHIVIGYDHKFGKGRSGDVALLKANAKLHSFKVHEISKQEVEDIIISSTKIRAALQDGRIATANTLLARPYSLTGQVVKGKQIGTEIGYPTANVKLIDKLKLIPKNGIYVCSVIVDNQRYQGMLYIGVIPTLQSNEQRTIEVNIFDFEADIYDKQITLELHKFLREDEKFSGLPELTAQLHKDKEDSLAYFNIPKGMDQPKVTVAILNYNSRDYLETFLPSVSFSSKAAFSTLVIDNASKDDSIEVVEEWFPEVEIVSLDSNHGFAEGYNIGLKGVQTEYIALINSDIEVTPGWLDPLVAYLDSHPSCAAVMPKILSYEHKQSFEYAGAAGGYLDYLAFPFCRGRIFDSIELDEGQYDSTHEVAWVSGAAFLIRRELYEGLGGFDGTYFAHQEEIDLCWRLRRAGYNLAVVAESVVYHVGGGTLNYGSAKKVFLNFRNSLSTIYKNEKTSSLFWKLPFRLVLDGVAGLKFLLSGEIGGFLAVIKAHFSFYFQYLSLRKRKKKEKALIAKYRIGSENRSGVYNKLIVVKHFISGIKSFSDLMKT